MGMKSSYKTYVPGRCQTTRKHVLLDSYSDDAAEHDAQVNGGNGCRVPTHYQKWV